MKRYVLTLVDLHAGKAEVAFATDRLTDIAEVRSTLAKLTKESGEAPLPPAQVAKGRPGPKGRPVTVLAVEEGYDGPLKAGDVFPTALDLCPLLGFSYNAVSAQLSAAKRRGEDSAILRGVEVKYADQGVRD